MRLFTEEKQWTGGETAVALGTFDGVHLGHAKLIRIARELARRHGLTSVAYTYSTHPMQAFRPDRVPPQLETAEEKARTLAMTGIGAAVMRPFSRAYAAQPPEAFLSGICGHLGMRYAVVGYNYSFGAKGIGKAEDMVRIGKKLGFETVVVDEVRIGGEAVSSTGIRQAVQAGDVRLAREWLGRPYALCGAVQPGRQMGRAIGFPTANVAYPSGKAIPAEGVYAAVTSVGGRTYDAAVNVGSHPTLPGAPIIEAHMPGYAGGALYGEPIRISFLERLRDERVFESVDALRRQLSLDAARAAEIATAYGNREVREE